MSSVLKSLVTVFFVLSTVPASAETHTQSQPVEPMVVVEDATPDRLSSAQVFVGLLLVALVALGYDDDGR